MSFPYASRPARRLRPKTPKSPWSRWIVFPAPSGHFRIVLFLTGFFVWLLGLLIDGRFFSFSVRLPFPMVSFFGYWGAFCVPSGFDGWLFRFRLRFLRSGSSFASFRLNGGLKGFFVCSPLGVVFRFSSFLFALRSPSFPMVSVFSLIPFKALFFFCLRSLFRLFALGSTSFPFPFSLIRPALPFISFVVFGFLSTSPHRDAPSGGGVGRAAWPRPTPSASVRPSRRIGRASSRCHCVACWRRPCPGPGPA